MTHQTPESGLNAVAQGMGPLFEALDAPLPDRVRVAIGFTSAGAKGKAIGESWDNRLSADGHFEIFIRPDLSHAPDALPAQIAAILAHELAQDRTLLVYGKRLSVRLDPGGRRIIKNTKITSYVKSHSTNTHHT